MNARWLIFFAATLFNGIVLAQKLEVSVQYSYLFNPVYRYEQQVFTFSRPWLSQKINFLQHGVSNDIRYTFNVQKKVPFSISLHSDYFHLQSQGYDLPSIDLFSISPECDWTFKVKGSFKIVGGIGVFGSAMKRDFPNEPTILDNEMRWALGVGVSIKTGVFYCFWNERMAAGICLRSIPAWYAPDAEVMLNNTKGLLSGPITYSFHPSAGLSYSFGTMK